MSRRATHVRRGLAAAAACAAMAWWLALPDPLFDAPLARVLQARDGSLLGARVAADGQWRFPPVAEVPPKFRAALLAAEDKRFEHHPGIDPLALARALRLNWQHGRVVSGGSTLTMQTVRLARGNPPRTLREKAVEALLALRLETGHAKAEILALYASHAPFGGNTVGLEAAAWRYFGHAPQALSWAESATLAVLPNRPALIHPGRERAALQARRDALLARLHARGQLSALDLAAALHEPLPDAPRPLPQLAPHLLDTLAAAAPATHRLRSTLDAALQARAAAAVQQHAQRLRAQGVHNAAAIVIDHQRHEVLAYVGNTEAGADGEQGHAVDVLQRPRSTGSLLKPFLYATMLDAGELLPTQLVPDIPTHIAGYAPQNYDRAWRGAVPAQEALARSLNVPMVRLLREHGVARFHDGLRALGMQTLVRAPDGYGLTLVLGGAEGTLWELAQMYAGLADAARGQPPQPARLALDAAAAPPRAALISPGAAWLTLQALHDVARPGDEAHWRQYTGARRIAWKTGTSFGHRDAWAIGVDGRHTVGVWAGNASGEGRPGLTGALAAAPLLFALFDRLAPAPGLEPPTRHLKWADVCRDDGFLADGLCETHAVQVPLTSHFAVRSPHHRRVQLAADGRHRVHSGCESPGRMQHRAWFVLSPAQAVHYRREHAGYRPLPPWRSDCRDGAGHPDEGRSDAVELVYPPPGTAVYIPTDLAARRGRVVLSAAHRDPDAALMWHLDGQYQGRTVLFHQLAVDLAPGRHELTVVDARGQRATRSFDVLGAP